MASPFLQMLGRGLIVMIFFGAGINKLQTFEKETGGPATALMAPKLDAFLQRASSLTGLDIKLPKANYPQVLMGACVLEVFGGLLFLLNLKFGAVLLIAFLVPTSFIMHNFWDDTDPQSHQENLAHFMKNMSILGALLYFLGTSDGKPHVLGKRHGMVYKLD